MLISLIYWPPLSLPNGLINSSFYGQDEVMHELSNMDFCSPRLTYFQPVECPICQQQRPILHLQHSTIPNGLFNLHSGRLSVLDHFYHRKGSVTYYLKQTFTLDKDLSSPCTKHLSKILSMDLQNAFTP